MIRLERILLHPVKGLRGHDVIEAVTEARGLAGDRRMMVVDDDGKFVTQRTHPKMVQVRARWSQGSVALEHGSRTCTPTVDGDVVEATVWASVVRAREVPEGSRFLTDALGFSCRLVRLPDAERRPATSSAASPGDEVSFADAFPYLLASSSSLADLSGRAGVELAMERFRPNFVVSGLAPWAEDDVRTFAIGDASFQNRKPCDRCSVTTVDPDTAETGKEPLETLARFRKRDGKVYFGVNLVAVRHAVVRAGDVVRVA